MTAATHTPGPWLDLDDNAITVRRADGSCAASFPRYGAGHEQTNDFRTSAENVLALLADNERLRAALGQLLSEVDDMTKRAGWAGNGGRDMARAALAGGGK